MTQPIVWELDATGRERSRTSAFMRSHGIEDYAQLVLRSQEDPAWFWDAAIDELGIPFSTPYTEVFDSSDGIEWTKWFIGGKINLSEACVDRWAATDPQAPAVIAEHEDGSSETISFAELADRTSRLAGGYSPSAAATTSSSEGVSGASLKRASRR